MSGVLRLVPDWAGTPHLRAGGRLRLHPNDLFALGPQHGGINERRLGRFMEVNGEAVPLPDFPVRASLVDNAVAAPLQLRPGATAVYFPVQYNHSPGAFPLGYFGLEPGASRTPVRRCLERWGEGDNGILYLSRAFKLRPGTGWQLDANVLHALGTLVTYQLTDGEEEAFVYESICAGDPLPWEQGQDIDAVLDRIDYEKSTDPFFMQIYHRPPVLAGHSEEHFERWIVYGSGRFSAKELTVAPGATVVVTEPQPFVALAVQGHGALGGLEVETPQQLRYGQMSADEFFVPAGDVTISNASRTEPLVLLKHFGPGHPGAEEFIECK